VPLEKGLELPASVVVVGGRYVDVRIGEICRGMCRHALSEGPSIRGPHSTDPRAIDRAERRQGPQTIDLLPPADHSLQCLGDGIRFGASAQSLACAVEERLIQVERFFAAPVREPR